ncbi:MAG: hypothetical protein Q8R55_00825 [Candidatus Taylorbacteria bacterium]|nr:hypothetical protein [Candidatus Taylorbacteria bacterium]
MTDAMTDRRIVWLFFKDIEDWDKFYKFPGRILNFYKRRQLENHILGCGQVVNMGTTSYFSPTKTGHFWIVPFQREGYGKDAYQALEKRLNDLCEKYPFLDVTYKDQHPPVSREDAENALRTLARINNISVEEMRSWFDDFTNKYFNSRRQK